ncbi:MAG: tetratricopeptide repeat protein, partial [Mesorhizobium sp.]
AYAQNAMSLDMSDLGHRALGYARLCEGKLEEAESAFQTALRINPNHADTLANMAGLRVLQGQPYDAIELAEHALRLNPYPPGWYYWDLGFAYYAAGHYTEAVRVLRKEEVGGYRQSASLRRAWRSSVSSPKLTRKPVGSLRQIPASSHLVGQLRSLLDAMRTGSISLTAIKAGLPL